MGLLDQVIGAATSGLGNGGQSQSPLANVIMQLLSGQQGGGLNGLVQQFMGAGLENIVKSWVGTGANLPVGADQLGKVFGAERVQQFSTQAGIPVDQLLSQLAQHLPNVVDRMTPNGQVPEVGAESDLLQQGLKMFLGGPPLKV